MESKIIPNIPDNLIYFVLTTIFSLLIGLSQRSFHAGKEKKRLFGTDRTFTFIGILGFITYIIQPQTLIVYIAGGIALTFFLGINYYKKIDLYEDFGLTTIIIAMLTYALPPIIITQKPVVYLSVVITILITTEMRDNFKTFSTKITNEEFVTLSKFIVIAGIILPLVPDEPLFSFVDLSPFKIWLAVVVISTISYISYIIRKYIFRESGILISGILGGLYSSTATTLVLSKKAKETTKNEMYKYSTAIILATMMMYLRILVLMLIFNTELFYRLFFLFLIMSFVCGVIAWFINKYSSNIITAEGNSNTIQYEEKNPLEFKVALIFTVMYVAFTFITYFTIKYFGNTGLSVLSWIVGMTDIDPFLINIFQGKYDVTNDILVIATLQAIVSNNILKFFYTFLFSSKLVWKQTLIAFLIINVVNVLLMLLLI